MLLLAFFFVSGPLSLGESVPSHNDYDVEIAKKLLWLSAAAYCDGRDGFDDKLFKTWTCGRACTKVCGNKAKPCMQKVQPIPSPGADSFALVGKMSEMGGQCVVSFKGTGNPSAMWRNVQSKELVALEDCFDSKGAQCRVGRGIKESYDSVKDKIVSHLDALDCSGKKVAFTGHSLGAAQAILAVWDLRKRFNIQTSYTFGQPVVGDDVFHDVFAKELGSLSIFRITHASDPIPHFGPFDDAGAVNGFLGKNGLCTRHQGIEIFYQGSLNVGYKICKEDDEFKGCSYEYFKQQTGVDVLNIKRNVGIAAAFSKLKQSNFHDHMVYLDIPIAGEESAGNCKISRRLGALPPIYS